MTPSVNLRDIQHFLYCPHRWGLLNINDDWCENVGVIRANLFHERVHSGKLLASSSRDGAWAMSSVSVYQDELDLYGVIDRLEFLRSDNGVYVPSLDCRCEITIVEYKPTHPSQEKFSLPDALQVFAQKRCVDYIFKGDAQCCLYYGDVRRRTVLPFASDRDRYDLLLAETVGQMKKYLSASVIPPVSRTQKCSGCSMADVCLSKCAAHASLKEIIRSQQREW